MPTNLTSPVWNDEAVDGIISRCLTRLVKRFKNERVQDMASSPHTGVVYKKYGDAGTAGGPGGFRRFHQASARGQRPAPDTFNLSNSLRDEKLNPQQHRFYVDDITAPYGKYLQDPTVLDRPIATQEDADAFVKSAPAKADIEKARQEIINGVTGEV